jgi:hypothetical protein
MNCLDGLERFSRPSSSRTALSDSKRTSAATPHIDANAEPDKRNIVTNAIIGLVAMLIMFSTYWP